VGRTPNINNADGLFVQRKCSVMLKPTSPTNEPSIYGAAQDEVCRNQWLTFLRDCYFDLFHPTKPTHTCESPVERSKRVQWLVACIRKQLFGDHAFILYENDPTGVRPGKTEYYLPKESG
jgi:hypothetical protein